MKKHIILASIAAIILLGLGVSIYRSKSPNISDTENSQKEAVKKDVANYFGNIAYGDFDGDGRKDGAFIITRETGGSGTFFYLIVALNTVDGYVNSQEFFLGDRIAPQATTIGVPGNPKVIVVNYADRKPGESFVTPPSVGKSVWLLLDPETLELKDITPKK
jgi:hypothetical protein